MGQSPPGSSYNETGNGIPFFQGKAEFGEVHPTVRKYTTAGTKHAKSGDILMSVRAPVGPTNIADIDCVIGRGLAAIRGNELISQKYLTWTLKHLELEIQGKGKGTTFDSISGDALRGTVVYLPELPEQERIVEILEDHLSRLDAALADVKQAKLKAAQFRRSLLQAAFAGDLLVRERDFEWKLMTIQDVTSKVSKVDPSTLNRDTFRYVDIGSIRSSVCDSESTSEVETNNAPGRARQLLEYGDTVFPTVRPYMRKIAWISKSLDGEIASTGFCVLRANKSLVSERYLHLYSLSETLMDQLLPLQRGVSYPAIRDRDVFSAKIPVPPPAVQAQIVEQLDTQLSLIQNAINSTNSIEVYAASLRRSLLQAAFTGQLTKKEVNV
jgi:type I restriction enzyme S subunit